MRSDNWWMYNEEDPFEEMARQFVDSMGAPFTVTMEHFYWAYVDWLDEETNWPTAEWMLECEKLYVPSEQKSFDNMFKRAVFSRFIRREKRGQTRPPWILPATPEQLQQADV
ncbi:hypothetical protein [Pseudaestuariivita rosea]|uniref:hypothetical protein n=1 Tax=Pseudaestuariivita rosea TaxID=2763263 RepID=UPI001ABA355C|nr:hypothetical protein [Pseudaestuariivita rosea]